MAITDFDPTSNEYFYITDLPEQFGGGKNSFVVNITPKIVSTAEVKVVVYDSLGNVLPTRIAKPVNSKFGGETATGVIYTTDVVNDTKTGIGKIEIISKVLQNDVITDITWTRNILIDSSLKSISKVSFFSIPYIDVISEIHIVPQYQTGSYVLSTGTFNSTAVFPRHNHNGDYEFQFNSTIYQINRSEGNAFSSSMEGEKIRLSNIVVQSFTYTNNTIATLTYSGPLSTDFIATVKRVINSNSILIDVPFRTVSDIINRFNKDSEYEKNNLVDIEGYTPENNPTKQISYYKKNFYALSLSSGTFEIIHKKIPTILSQAVDSGSIGFNRSFLNVEFRNIRTVGGAVSSYKIFGRSLNTPQSKTLMAEGSADSPELVISTNFNNGYYNLPGNFYNNSHLSRFWMTSSAAITFSQDSSTLIDGARISHAGNGNQSDYVILKDDAIEVGRTPTYVPPNLLNGSYWYGKNQTFNNVTVYPSASFYDASTIAPINSFISSQENLLSGINHNSNPIKLVSNCLYNFSMLVKASATNNENSVIYVYFISGTEITQIGIIDSSFRFGANELYSNSFFVTNTKYGTIKLIPVFGEWHISNVSIKPYKTNSFSSDYFSIKIPINNTVKNELFEVEAELYDGSGKLCYGSDSYTFAYNTVYSPLRKQVYVDPYGISIGVGGGSGRSGLPGPIGPIGPSGSFPNSGSYVVTSSGALSNLTASYAITASYALFALSSSYSTPIVSVVSASWASSSISSSYAVSASYSTTSSYAVSASYFLNCLPTIGNRFSRLVKNITPNIINASIDTRWVQADFFNVRDYGAVGDGTTNDTTAINLAISASRATGRGTVYFPDGIFVITGALSLPANPQCDINIKGNGANVSIIQQNTAGQGCINFNMDSGGTSDQLYQVGVRNVSFYAGVPAAGNAVEITYGTSEVSQHVDPSVTMDDVQIRSDGTNYWSNGIILESTWNFVLNKVMVIGKNVASSGFIGSAFELRRISINGSISQCQFNFWDTGIYINTVNYTSTGQNTEGIFMDNIYMVPVKHGLKIMGNATFTGYGVDWAGRQEGGRVSMVTFLNSHVDSRDSGSCVWFENVNDYHVSKNLLISSVGPLGYTVMLSGSYEGALTDNILFNPSDNPAVIVNGISTANIITANVFRGSPGTDVVLGSATKYNKVYGNTAQQSLTPIVSDLGTFNLVGSSGT